MKHSSGLRIAMTAHTILVLCVVLLLQHLDVITGRQRLKYTQYDALFVARCEAKCWYTKAKGSCIKACLAKGGQKPGVCPQNASMMPPFAAACLNECIQDSECPGLAKCCKHRCGITCQQPQDLLSAVDLPDIPKEIRITEIIKKRTIKMEWKPPKLNKSKIIYVVEERHHTGSRFIESRMTPWNPTSSTPKTSITLKNFAKPGRWYQFRLAAVNENGTKGYSDNSVTLKASPDPKPPKAPQNVTVGPLWVANGTLSSELRWSPPVSDLPIQRYKVFWSRRLQGVTALDSVLVHHQVVPHHQTKFLLQNLQSNSLYFLQVQAIVQFGKQRLKGEKSGLVLNTTNFTNITDGGLGTKVGEKTRIEGLHLQKLFLLQGDLHARVSWKPKKGSIRYTVSWWSGNCQENHSLFNHFKLAATTKINHFDLYDLQYNCRYRVSVRQVTPEGMKSMEESSITITTPSCKDFKSNYKKLKCEN